MPLGMEVGLGLDLNLPSKNPPPASEISKTEPCLLRTTYTEKFLGLTKNPLTTLLSYPPPHGATGSPSAIAFMFASHCVYIIVFVFGRPFAQELSSS